MLQLSLALAILSSFFILARAEPPINITFPSQPPEAQYNVINDNFIGISWELSSFDTLCSCAGSK